MKKRDKSDSKHQVKFSLNVLRLNKFHSELLYLSFYDLLEIINQFKVTKNLIFTSILTLLDFRLIDSKQEKRSAVTHCYEHVWIDQSSDLTLINLMLCLSLNLAHLFESFLALLLVVQHFLHSSFSSFF